MAKPNFLTQLTPGKAIGNDCQKGFTETFNWLVRFCNNLRGDGISVVIDNPLGDWPVVRSKNVTATYEPESESESEPEYNIRTDNVSINKQTGDPNVIQVYDFEAPTSGDKSSHNLPTWDKNGNTIRFLAREGNSVGALKYVSLYQGETYGSFRVQPYIDATHHKVTMCNYQFGRIAYSLADQTITDGTWYLSIPHSSPGSATVTTSPTSTSKTHTSIPLFAINNGIVTNDYRGMPTIPVWGTATT